MYLFEILTFIFTTLLLAIVFGVTLKCLQHLTNTKNNKPKKPLLGDVTFLIAIQILVQQLFALGEGTWLLTFRFSPIVLTYQNNAYQGYWGYVLELPVSRDIFWQLWGVVWLLATFLAFAIVGYSRWKLRGKRLLIFLVVTFIVSYLLVGPDSLNPTINSQKATNSSHAPDQHSSLFHS